jgi:hypothetical protein
MASSSVAEHSQLILTKNDTENAMKNLKAQFAVLLLSTLCLLTSAHGQITGVTAGTDLTGGGTSGNVTLNLNTAKVPQLATANTFTGNQTVNGNLSASGAVTGASFQIGSNLFDFGSYANGNAFLGFSGNSTMTGVANTAAGVQALLDNTTGFYNAAFGVGALTYNTTGLDNTAVGVQALYSNTTGSTNTGLGTAAGTTVNGAFLTGNNNTAVGFNAQFGGGAFSNATAIGANAVVGESNALVLGSIKGVSGGTASINVGIGTVTPNAALDVQPTSVQTLIGDPGCGSNFAGIGFVATGGFTNCTNYAVLGDVAGNVYINSTGSGTISFRNNNGYNPSLMTIDTHGDVNIKGNLSKGGGSFKIDDPLDPANKYLYHSFVESPDMMDIYNGVATLDAHGSAWIMLPEYFESLNQDFRYQLTSMGMPQPTLYVAREIAGNRFRVSGGKPAGKVSWQVTGIRHDAYANAHRIPVEVEKPPQEQGHYLHPELFGATPEQAVDYQMPPVQTAMKSLAAQPK